MEAKEEKIGKEEKEKTSKEKDLEKPAKEKEEKNKDEKPEKEKEKVSAKEEHLILSDIIYGIRHSVKKAGDNVKNELSEAEYSLEAKTVYNITRESEEKKRNFFFKDYAPKAFAGIRKLLGVSSKLFLKSWPMPQEDSALAESTARSGSLFYITNDKKYLFKTILHPEVTVMMTLLRDYHQHLLNFPKSFIVKIYGLFRYMSGGNKIWILIMGHTFPPTVGIKEKYDLKGRKPKPGKSIRERPRMGSVSAPHKDNEIDRVIRFVDDHKNFYIQQLKTDIELLKSHDIMDYSLLIGIHEVSDAELDEAAQIAAQDAEYFSSLPEEIQNLLQTHDSFLKVKSNEIVPPKKKKKAKETTRRSSASKSLSPEPAEKKNRRTTVDSDIPSTPLSTTNPRTTKLKEKDKPLKGVSDNANGRRKKNKSTEIEIKIEEITSSDQDAVKPKPRRAIKSSVIPQLQQQSQQQNSSETSTGGDSDSRKSSEIRTVLTSSRSRKRKVTDKKYPRTKSNELPLSSRPRKKKEKKLEQVPPPIIMKPLYRTIFDYGLIAIHPETQKQEILFLGIIDNLTNYTVAKQMANLFKSALWEAETLSTVPSSFYGDRFYKYLTTSLIGDINNLVFTSDDEPNGRLSAPDDTNNIQTERPKFLTVELTKLHSSSQPMVHPHHAQTERPVERLNSLPKSQNVSPRATLTTQYERSNRKLKHGHRNTLPAPPHAANPKIKIERDKPAPKSGAEHKRSGSENINKESSPRPGDLPVEKEEKKRKSVAINITRPVEEIPIENNSSNTPTKN